MTEIKYNYYKLSTNGGTSCVITKIENAELPKLNINKKSAPLIQTYDCGYRVDSEHGEYFDWNNTTFEDIDLKHLKKDGRYIFATPDKNDGNIFHPIQSMLQKFYEIYKKFIEYASEMYPNNFYWAQQSNSEVSWHCCFYFNCERNKENHDKCKILAQNMVYNVLKKLGLSKKDINSIYDNCTKNIGQGIFLTNFPIHFSEYIESCDGECDLSNIELENNDYNQVDITFSSDAQYKISDKFTELSDYLYNTRYKVMWIIFKYFNFDKDKCLEVYDKFCDDILKHRDDYTKKKLVKQFESAYNLSISKNYGYNRECLEYCKNNFGFKFDIDITFEGKRIDLNNSDITFELNENEHLSSKIDLITNNEHRIIHLFAGCGVGKTYFANELRNKGYRVCYVAPMKSVSANNFEKESTTDIESCGWFFVDGDHNKGQKQNWPEYKSVSTTWDSFYHFRMWEKNNFDYIIFDESHTLFQYDYRCTVVNDLISSMDYLINNCNAKIILLSGTPNAESNYFDCYKIRFNKKQELVKSELWFYDESCEMNIINDIKNWISQNINNKAYIFRDKSSYQNIDKLEKHGIFVDDIYIRSYEENVNIINETHNISGQVALFSVYGQVGINLDKLNVDDRIRVYILSNYACDIIQYANRIRNKKLIDKVIIPIKKSSIKTKYNNLKLSNNVDLEEIKLIENKINNIMCVGHKNVTKSPYILNIPKCIIYEDGKKLFINDSCWKIYNNIKETRQYEMQTQVIWNRLIDAYFDVEIINVETIKDTTKTKMRSNVFAGVIRKAKLEDILSLDSENKLVIKYNENKYNINRYMDDKTKHDIEKLLNEIYVKNDKNWVTLQTEWTNILNYIEKKTGSLRKKDIQDYCFSKSIINETETYVDSYFIRALQDERYNLCHSAALLAYKHLTNIEIEDNKYKDIAERAYNNIKELKKIIDKFTEIFDDYKDDTIHKKIDDIFELHDLSTIYYYLVEQHTSGKKGGKKGGKKNAAKKVIYNGVEYDSLTEMAKKLGVSRVTASKWLKSN